MKHPCDFSGWATRANLKCSDGLTIMKGAFEDNDGKKVPLVYNHLHNDPNLVLGHAILEKRDEGVYAYCYFNDTPNGQLMKQAVQHGDIDALSIYANNLKKQGSFVTHGNIRELSLVLAGANPGAFIDSIMAHGEESDDEAIIYTGEPLELAHADGDKQEPPKQEPPAKEKDPPKQEPPKQDPPSKEEKPEDEETVGDVYNAMTDKQKKVVHYMVGEALMQNSEGDSAGDKSKGGDNTMKHNVFEKEETQDTVLMHAETRQGIIALAKQNSVGSLRTAISIYAEQAANDGDEELKHSIDALQHGIDNIESLFPDYKDLRPGAPELLTRDQGWVNVVMNKVHKSPISRIRTRQMDARNERARGQGYQKGKRKSPAGNMNMVSRTTDPQTVYCIDALHRDDVIDITDFDVIEYQYGVMKQNLNEEVAIAIMVGDGRDEGSEMKISESHIRSIWNDDDLYTIHYDVDIAAARTKLQGSRTDMSFGEEFIYAEAIVAATLYSREKYKGTGNPDLFCTPHLLNVMLLARDMNGRRIYDSRTDLAAALNVAAIHTAEQFEGLVRVDEDGGKHQLLGIFVNLEDYTVGAVKGGEITRFDQFDIDFNQHKYLIETRLSGALTRLYSAIALEEPVKPASGGTTTP